MVEVYDLLAGTLATKADENMIGFAGFTRPALEENRHTEGMLKVSAFFRPNGSGYLTLTFIQDRGQCAAPLLGKARQRALSTLLGPNCEMVLDIPLTGFADITDFLVEELDVYFHQLRGQEKIILDQGLMPALTQVLGLELKPFQEWRGSGQS